ncbi:MAG: NAD(P)-dependent oxidoreductase [Chthoniobacteraceae bacterium]
MELILGANGYIGSHLAWSRRGRECLLHSGSPANEMCARTGLPFIRENLVEMRDRTAALNPETVWLLARPVTMEANIYLDFAQNAQWLLQEWADRGCLRRVVFASTQLVYATPPDARPIPVLSPLRPETAYDCHKAEMEFFLALLAHHPSIRSVEVHRLPLVAGREPSATARQMQFLFHWRQCYLAGTRWIFDTGNAMQDSWGNSWVHMDDLVRLLGEPAPEGQGKFHIRQPVSGHITYRQLDEFFTTHCELPPMRERMKLPQTCFFLEDNTGLPPRPIADVYTNDHAAAPLP